MTICEPPSNGAAARTARPGPGCALQESSSLFQEQDLTSFGAFVVYHLGRTAFANHDMLEANIRYQQSLALLRQEGDKLGEAMALTALGVVAAAQGDAVAAQSLLNQSVPLMRATGDRRDLTQSLLMAGTVRLKQGDLQQAHDLFSESLRLWDSMGDQDIAQARAHLDQAAFEAGWAAGQAMTQEQAISYALQGD